MGHTEETHLCLRVHNARRGRVKSVTHLNVTRWNVRLVTDQHDFNVAGDVVGLALKILGAQPAALLPKNEDLVKFCRIIVKWAEMEEEKGMQS